MKYLSVFDWAQVKLAEECICALFKENTPKQHIVSQLAAAGGVTATWDDSGKVKLEGAWEQILKSQVIFEDYLKSLEVLKVAKQGNKEVSPKEIPIQIDTKMKSNPQQCTTSTDYPMTKGKEVYVNITLSGTELSELDPKSIQLVNNIPNDSSSENLLCDDKIQATNSSIFGNESSFKQNVNESKTTVTITKLDSNLKESGYNVAAYQQEIVCSVSNSQVSDADFKEPNSTKTTLPSYANQDKQLSFGDSRKFNTDNKVRSSQNIQPLSDRKAVHLASDNIVDPCNAAISGQQRQKYHKKKDYEELAPYKFFCALCSFKSKRESHYAKHMKLHNKVSELFNCSHCKFTSIRLSHLRRHELNHSNLTLTCSMCHYQTNSQKLLVRHKRIKHNTTKVSEDKVTLYCVHCEYQTSRYNFLQRHMKVHVSDTISVQVYQCEQCSYKTNRKEHFVRHTNNIHKGQRPFLCHRCGKAFKRQDALKLHSSIHATQAAVTCPECGKGCRSQAHLSQHMSVHSSARSFLCELCGASFKTRAVQRKHMFTIHQHPKSFLCNHCSRKFSTKFALRRHEKQHSFLLSVEKKTKQHDQETPVPPTFSLENTNSMRLVAVDTAFLSEPARSHTLVQTATLNDTSREERITMQLAETCGTETVRVFPSQTVVQSSSETTALVYLTGTFTSL